MPSPSSTAAAPPGDVDRQGSQPAADSQEPIRVTKLHWPLAWLAAAVVAGAGLLWSFTATIPQMVSVPGSFISPAESVVVAATVAGTITGLPPCQPGCDVAAGQTIFQIAEFGSGKVTSVEATAAGTLGAVTVLRGTAVRAGAPLTILTLATPSADPAYSARYYAVASVSDSEATDFPVGSQAYVSPDSTDPQRNGAMKGTVVNVAQQLSALQPPAKQITDARYQVLVDLGETPQWTGVAPEDPPASGTPAVLARVDAESHPYLLVLGSRTS